MNNIRKKIIKLGNNTGDFNSVVKFNLSLLTHYVLSLQDQHKVLFFAEDSIDNINYFLFSEYAHILVLDGSLLVEGIGMRAAGDCFSVRKHLTWSPIAPGVLIAIDARESDFMQLYDPAINYYVNVTAWRQGLDGGSLKSGSSHNVEIGDFPFKCDFL